MFWWVGPTETEGETEPETEPEPEPEPEPEAGNERAASQCGAPTSRPWSPSMRCAKTPVTAIAALSGPFGQHPFKSGG